MFPSGQLSTAGNTEPGPLSRAGQSRRMSAVEAVTNVLVGIGVSFGLTLWLTGASPGQAAHWSAWFTAASLIRSYVLRRVFARF